MPRYMLVYEALCFSSICDLMKPRCEHESHLRGRWRHFVGSVVLRVGHSVKQEALATLCAPDTAR
jgi:hypothetical protein